ncbi:unnamed protein product [Polarella glacialis]|uniref:Hexosyltransferase n=1 Tax=Polarella glacialis TaxID=89957 RepID=A0A813EH96_POLGL|nr:unnamed protein product [Polarella glacialis]
MPSLCAAPRFCTPLAILATIHWVAQPCCCLRLGIMVTSRWAEHERRQTQRHAIHSCTPATGSGHDIELLFFMGDPHAEEEAAALREQAESGDLVQVGGPDTDPPVPRDATYVLDRPCARTFRLAHGTAWLAANRPEQDYVMYLDDDSFLNLPRLLFHLEHQATDRLAMGFVMETQLDWSSTHVCELCDPCEPCRNDTATLDFCAMFPDMSLGGCIMAVQNCQIFEDTEEDYTLARCVTEKHRAIARLAQYFGSTHAPRWMLGMGWVFGSRIVQYIGRNANRLKVRGAADVSLGFWLAPMEGVRFVSMNDGYFHDHPESKSIFARPCTDQSVLVHRMTPASWNAGFDAEKCELTCDGAGSIEA